MLPNHLTFIIRNLMRHRVYSLFSILSLGIGLMCCILVWQYVKDELSYDAFLEDADGIHRLEYRSWTQSGAVEEFAYLPGHYLPAGLSSIPEIETTTRIARLPNLFLGSGPDRRAESGGFAADSIFFRLFSFGIPDGSAHPLSTPGSIVLTRDLARRHFGEESPVGRSLVISYGQAETPLSVTAVMENLPDNTHLDFSFLIDETTFRQLFNRNLSRAYTAYQYVRLTPSSGIGAVERKLAEIKPPVDIPEGVSFRFDYALQPVQDIHLHSSGRGEIKAGSDISNIYFFSLGAVAILAISIINFISLMLSRTFPRFREIGVRKALGADNRQVMHQLLAESVCISVLSLLLALLLTRFLLPLFNTLTGKGYLFPDLVTPDLVGKYLLLALAVGLASGIYPARFLVRRAGNALRSNFSASGSRSSLFQHAVVVIQFSASAVLLAGTIVVYSQMNYLWDKDLGFDREGIITAPNAMGSSLERFRNRLGSQSGIESISASSYIPGTSESGGSGPVLSPENGTSVTASWISVDYDFFQTYRIDIVSGRSFSREYAADSTQAFIINRQAAAALGLEDPVGREIRAMNRTGEIIGVVEDFNYLSLHQQIPPMVFLIDDTYWFSLSVRYTGNPQKVLGGMENAWNALQPGVPFEYQFLDNQFAELYSGDRHIQQSFPLFSLLAIIVACLGLFSLAAFSMRRKRREIGIRKVFGATILNILKMNYLGYLRLIILANLIAIPVAWYLLSGWLSSFAYRIEIGIFPFLAAVLITCILTAITISYWSLKSAFANPVDSIQAE